MTNPFRFGGSVADDDFCDRKREIDRLASEALEGACLLVPASRRAGKTSLLRAVGRRLGARGARVIRVSLWAAEEEFLFASAFARGLTESGLPMPDARGGEGTGKTFEPGERCARALEVTARAAAATDRPVVVLYDDADRIADMTRAVGDALAESVRAPDGVSHILFGSGPRRMDRVFGNGDGPPASVAERLPLGPIPFEAWLPFVLERFLETNRWLSNEHARELWELSGGHAHYTQHLFHVLWDLCREAGRVEESMLAEALDRVVEREGSAYAVLWESLTSNQRRFLIGIALEGDDIQPYGAEFVDRYRLKSPSNSQRSFRALGRRDILGGESRDFRIVDPFLAEWIRRRAAALFKYI